MEFCSYIMQLIMIIIIIIAYPFGKLIWKKNIEKLRGLNSRKKKPKEIITSEIFQGWNQFSKFYWIFILVN